MDGVEGARTFRVAAAAYDSFMGRYSGPLAHQFADAAGVRRGQTALDIGCGPGALTAVLVERLGSESVAACDPSPGFVTECAARHAGVRVETGRAENIPFDSQSFDHAMAQLVLHFVSEPDLVAGQMLRVVRPGGSVSACVWDFDGGMEMLRSFWDAAHDVMPSVPDEAGAVRFGAPGEIAELFASAGMQEIEESTIRVTSAYSSFDEFWDGFLAGVGPAGSFCISLSDADQARVRSALFERMGRPSVGFTLGAVARCAVGRTPT